MTNEIRGTAGDDTITGTSGDDLIKTFEGDDVVIAGSGDDEVYTGRGDDEIDGGSGDDYLVGNEGNDILLGGVGDDRLFGCEDDDILDGGAGQDFLNAGTGDDILIFTASENLGNRGPDYYSGLDGIDTLRLNLTQSQFAAAQGDIAAFLDYVAQTTGSNGESVGPFFRFSTLNLAVQEVENLEIFVGRDLVFTNAPEAADDIFAGSEKGDITGTVADNDTVNPDSVFTITQNVSRGVLILNADGTFSFGTAGDFDALDDGQVTTETFTYTVTSPNADPVTATVTLTITGQNDAPVVTAIDAVENEDAPSFLIDLLAGAMDPDANDVLSISNAQLSDGTTTVAVPVNAQGADGGVNAAPNGGTTAANVITAGVLAIDLSLYQYLAVGESLALSLTYDVSDGDAVTPNTASILITGENDIPTVTAALSADISEGAMPLTLNLLDGASDIDASDVLNVENLSVNGNAAGLVQNGNSVTVDASAYSNLGAGETETIVLTYDVSDGNGGIVVQTATITITGTNDAPEVVGPLFSDFLEDDAGFSFDLLDGASDVNGDALTVINFMPMVAGFTFDAASNTLLVDPTDASFQELADGDTRVVSFTFDIMDGQGGVVSQTAEFEIIGVNDAPVVVAPLSLMVDETATVTLLDLLSGASDVDLGDVLAIDNLVLISGNDVGVTQIGNSLSVDAAVYAPLLNAGDIETLTYSFNVVDGNGGVTAQTATIAINGQGGVSPVPNTAPTVTGPLLNSFIEDAASFSFDLLDGANDADGDVLSVINFLPMVAGFVFDSASNSLLIDPSDNSFQDLAQGQTRSVTFNYDISDGNGGIISQTADFTITGVNDDPTLAGPIVLTLQETDTVTFIDLFAGVTDVDNGDAVIINAINLVSGDDVGISVNSADISVDPLAYAASLNAGDTAVIIYTVEYTDLFGGSAIQDVTINIIGSGTPTNSPPDPFDFIEFITNEDAAVGTVDLLLGSSDPDGDTLTVTNLSTLPVGVTFDTASNSLLVDPSSYQSLAVGTTALFTVNYDVIDGNGGTVSNFAEITIEGLNDDPVTSGALTFNFLTSDTSTTFVDLLTNASDIDVGDTLSAADPTLVSGDDAGIITSLGTLGIDPSAYTVAVGASITIVYEVEISDGNGGTVTQIVNLIVEGVANSPPVSNEFGIIFIDEDGGTSFAGSAQGANDPDGDALTAINIPTLPTWLTFDAVNQRFTADGDDPIFDSLRDGESAFFTFEYDLSDGNGGTVGHGVNIFVEGVNDDPVVTGPLTLITQEDSTLDFLDLLQGASDVDNGDQLSVRNITGLNGAFSVNYAFGELLIETIDDALDFIRINETFDFVISYEIHDLFGGFTTQTATISVEGSNDAPEIDGGLSATVAEGGTNGVRVFNLLQGATDPENTALSVTNFIPPSFLPTGVFVFDAVAGTLTVDTTGYNVASIEENYSFSFDVTDADGGTASRTIDITIDFEKIVPNNNPSTSPINLALDEDSLPAFIDLLQGASDPDTADVLQVVNIGTLPDGFFFNSVTNQITLNSFAFQSLRGSDIEFYTIEYTIEDGNGGFVEQTLDVSIQGQNDAPTNFSPVSRTFSEDSGLIRIDLLVNSTDVDAGDVLSISGPILLDGLQGTVFDGERFLGIDLDESAYQSLGAGESAVFNISYNVADEMGATVTQTSIITINGANDVATATDDTGVRLASSSGVFTSDLEFLVNEIDTNDAFTIQSVTLATGSPAAVFSFTGTSFTIDEAQFTPDLVDRVVTFDVTLTSGPDTIVTTLEITILAIGATPQDPRDSKEEINLIEPDPTPPEIIKDGPDGVYADGLNDNLDDSSGFDFADSVDLFVMVDTALDNELSPFNKFDALSNMGAGDPSNWDSVHMVQDGFDSLDAHMIDGFDFVI